MQDIFVRFRSYLAVSGIEGFLKSHAVAISVSAFVVAVILISFIFANSAPIGFPAHAVFTVDEGQSISEVASNLKNRGIVSSALLFENLVVLLGRERDMIAGDYYFPETLTLLGVVDRITRGEYGMYPVRVTVLEGSNIEEIATLFARRFGRFDPDRFKEIAREKEGYLFPDTYFFMPNATAEDVLVLLSDNFDARTAEVVGLVEESGRTLHEVVTMASILEEEAGTLEDKRLVSGLLWRRIKIDMPMQVDATFVYVNGKKNSFDLTKDDLASDTPYNTYVNKGLPPGPISNPGLESIMAALEPTESDYLFYMSDNSGNMYFAKDFEGHKRNRELYLGR